jgi:hypothetical protein
LPSAHRVPSVPVTPLSRFPSACTFRGGEEIDDASSCRGRSCSLG